MTLQNIVFFFFPYKIHDITENFFILEIFMTLQKTFFHQKCSYFYQTLTFTYLISLLKHQTILQELVRLKCF